LPDTIPWYIRKAVIMRDRAWPRRNRPAVYCDVHHTRHKKDGGEASIGNCVLGQFHHDVCIHRWGWELTLHPDGTTSAYGPDGRALHSHSPPTAARDEPRHRTAAGIYKGITNTDRACRITDTAHLGLITALPARTRSGMVI